MFTGIVEKTAAIESFRKVPGGCRLRIRAGSVAQDIVAGASLCVCGVCLTVAGVDRDFIDFDVIKETLDRTTLGRKRVGQSVNLERSLQVGGRLDGHFVQGHIDGIATVVEIKAAVTEHVVWLRPESALAAFVIPKGSIAIDGVSLTIAEVSRERFCVALIPMTLERTTLAVLSVGEDVNIETDILVRTVVHRLSEMSGEQRLTMDVLSQAGFA